MPSNVSSALADPAGVPRPASEPSGGPPTGSEAPGQGSPAEPRLAGGPGGAAALGPLLTTALDVLADASARRRGPLPAGRPAELAHGWRAGLGEVLPADGTGAATALAEMTALLGAGSADPADPFCAGHLHCPPLAVAVAAEAVAGVLNPSLDSWDQGLAACVVEEEVVRALARLTGLAEDAAGVFTTGGTESNLMGLLLARDHAARRHLGVSAARNGLPAAAGRLRILCSAAAHFSVARAAGFLGLGEESVVTVPADRGHRMDPGALRRELARISSAGEIPIAVVATAGTTDLGAIDPLPQIADIAAEFGAWLHVDAAYGGGALFSARLAPLLAGIERADSVALDLHKLGWQPVAAGVFLVREEETLAPLARQVAYLNPADDERAGYASLLGRSLRTTRRPDAVKVAVTLRAFGRTGLGSLVDHCHDLARHAAARVAAHPDLELYADPVLSTVVFRFTAGDSSDEINAALRRSLLRFGRAVVGRTTIPDETGRDAVYLKLTLLNPAATAGHIDALLHAVVSAGHAAS